ncbi:hypothetical protein K443DRAFT_687069 [Laccaria amethystina LaAM-08-1]|uniref:Unplaced genomic scaffold K443scaffold_850, whole genome shotgun sequence n=1 Tax=Laccaria amethystina LaAM-08-1 TaxID=1095629 RepID=A0A0C9WQB8_9AGAR|nr:hypothetical protein K443DRAFT_687069 [Laccaria amethystina LaAM-08-1]
MRSKCWLSVYWVTPERQPHRHGIHHKGRLNAADLERPWIKNTRHRHPPFLNAEEHLEVLHKFTKVDPQDPAARIVCGIQK